MEQEIINHLVFFVSASIFFCGFAAGAVCSVLVSVIFTFRKWRRDGACGIS